MIILGPIVQRLSAAGCRNCFGVLEYSALNAAPAQLPAHFVVPRADTPSANRTSGIIDQRVVSEFSVIIVIAAQAAMHGRPSEEMTAAIRSVVDCLVGWQVPETAAPIEYAGGRLLSAGGREAVWDARFKSAYHIRRQAQ